MVFLEEFAECSMILQLGEYIIYGGEQMSLLCVISSFCKGCKTIMQVSLALLKDDINV